MPLRRAATRKSKDDLMVGGSKASQSDPRPGALAKLKSHIPEAFVGTSARLRFAPQQFTGNGLQSATAELMAKAISGACRIASVTDDSYLQTVPSPSNASETPPFLAPRKCRHVRIGQQRRFWYFLRRSGYPSDTYRESGHRGSAAQCHLRRFWHVRVMSG